MPTETAEEIRNAVEEITEYYKNILELYSQDNAIPCHLVREAILYFKKINEKPEFIPDKVWKLMISDP